MPTDFFHWLSNCHLQGPCEFAENISQAVGNSLNRFADYLVHQYSCNSLDDVTSEMLENYPATGKTDSWGLYLYYAYHERYEILPVFNPAFINRYSLNKTIYNLLPHLQLDKQYARLLRAEKIILASDLLHRTLTREHRVTLARRTGIPEDDLLRLVKGSDISRMLGMMGKTLQRCIAMGYDTLPMFRRVTSDELKAQLQRYLELRHERTSAMIDYGWYPPEARQLADLIDYD